MEPRAETFEQCYARYRAEALNLAWLLAGDRQRAEDAVADVFLKVYRRWDAGEILAPRAYIRRAVTNEVTSGFRRVTRERALVRNTPATVSDGEVDRVLDREEIRELLARLPPRQRTAVTLRYLLDLSEAEVALRMGTSVGTVKSSAARGLAALRVYLSGPARPVSPNAAASTSTHAAAGRR